MKQFKRYSEKKKAKMSRIKFDYFFIGRKLWQVPCDISKCLFNMIFFFYF